MPILKDDGQVAKGAELHVLIRKSQMGKYSHKN